MKSESSEKKIKILDVTIRDGSYAINYQYKPDQVARIVHQLDRAGIPLIEVSHGCGLGARENLGLNAAASDAEYVAAARKASRRAKIGVIASSELITKREQIDAVIDSVDFIRFAANVDDIGAIEKNIDYTLSRKVDVFVQIMRSSRRSPKDVLAAAIKAESMGAKLVYVVDTVGYFLPDQVKDIVLNLKDKLSIEVGFHAHNNLGLAIANTMSAIEAGCDVVDASLRGMGRSSGNAQLEVLVSLMKRKALAESIDLDILIQAGNSLIAPIMPALKGIEAIDLIMADVNIDLYPIPFYRQIADELSIDLHSLVRQLAKYREVAEINFPQIKKAIAHFGADPDKLLRKIVNISTHGSSD